MITPMPKNTRTDKNNPITIAIVPHDVAIFRLVSFIFPQHGL
jgi:hypothetical protein